MGDPCAPGRRRHWRVAFGTRGLRAPVCSYCGSPRRGGLSVREWRELLAWSECYPSLGEHVHQALREHQDEQLRVQQVLARLGSR